MKAAREGKAQELRAEDQSPSTIRNSIKPLQAFYCRARAREGLAVNPTRDLELPAPNAKEVEVVAPDGAAQLLDVLPVEDRALWATALYAGLALRRASRSPLVGG